MGTAYPAIFGEARKGTQGQAPTSTAQILRQKSW